MAGWCIATGQDPQVWLALTVQQREAFLGAVQNANKRR